MAGVGVVLSSHNCGSPRQWTRLRSHQCEIEISGKLVSARRVNMSLADPAGEVESARANVHIVLNEPVILQEYDAPTIELGMNQAEFGNLAAKQNLVEIAEACRREADACTRNS